MAREYLTKTPVGPFDILESEFLFAEGFEGTPEITVTSEPAGGYARKNPAFVLGGNYALEVATNPTSPQAGDQIEAYRRTCLITAPKLSLTAFIKPYSNYANSYIVFGFNTTLLDLSGQAFVFARINVATGDVSVKTGAATWTSIGTLPITLSQIWYLMEITYDLVKNKCGIVRIGDKIFDASDYTPYTPAIVDLSIYFGVALLTNSAAQATMFVDNLILRALPK